MKICPCSCKPLSSNDRSISFLGELLNSQNPGIPEIDYSRALCLGADQKKCGLWEQDCLFSQWFFFCFATKVDKRGESTARGVRTPKPNIKSM